MNDKGDLLKKSALKEKVEVESATVQFREFHSFTEGLLAQGTPHEIAGTHKMVSELLLALFLFAWVMFVTAFLLGPSQK